MILTTNFKKPNGKKIASFKPTYNKAKLYD